VNSLLLIAEKLPSHAELVWQHLPASWGIFLLLGAAAAAVYGVVALYRRELCTCPPWARLLLAALRSAVVLLLIGVFVSPALVTVQYRTLLPTIVIARDASQSMNTADRYTGERYMGERTAVKVAGLVNQSPGATNTRGVTRAELVNALLAADGSRLVESLRRKGKLQLLDFGADIRKIAPTNSAARAPRQLPPLEADQRSTDIARAVQEGLTADRPAAIIVLTDGQQTTGDARAAASQAKARGVPLLVVGIGDERRPSLVRVMRIDARPQAWKNEPFEVAAILQFQNAAAGERRVELLEQPIDARQQPLGSAAVVQSLTVNVPEGGSGQATARFSYTPGAAGRFLYAVRVESLAADSADDRPPPTSPPPTSIVNVVDHPSLRVLLIAGAPTWDYRLVEQLLARDKTIAVSCWLQTLAAGQPQAGTLKIDHLPRTKEELFDYDVVLLLDADPDALPSNWGERVRQFVGEHAGGLVVVAGTQHFGRLVASERTMELANLLPVTFADAASLKVATLLTAHERAWPMQLLPSAADHPAVRFFEDREATRRRWESLPGAFSVFPCTGVRPTAEVLVEHGDPAARTASGSRPLLVAGRYGLGRTLYLGTGDTWRWRRSGQHAEFFDKFWIQAVRYLADGRSLEGERRGYVESDRDRYEIGERASVRARLQDAAYEPLVASNITATLDVAGEPGGSVPLLAVADQPGVFEGTFTPRQAGMHTLRIVLPDEKTGEPIQTSFRVELPSAETSETWLNRPLLEELAERSGGRYFDVTTIDQLASAVPDRIETAESRSEPEPLWDRPAMLVLLVGLLCSEWLLRKRFELL
jgi:hypothetical protein